MGRILYFSSIVALRSANELTPAESSVVIFTEQKTHPIVGGKFKDELQIKADDCSVTYSNMESGFLQYLRNPGAKTDFALEIARKLPALCEPPFERRDLYTVSSPASAGDSIVVVNAPISGETEKWSASLQPSLEYPRLTCTQGNVKVGSITFSKARLGSAAVKKNSDVLVISKWVHERVIEYPEREQETKKSTGNSLSSILSSFTSPKKVIEPKGHFSSYLGHVTSEDEDAAKFYCEMLNFRRDRVLKAVEKLGDSSYGNECGDGKDAAYDIRITQTFVVENSDGNCEVRFHQLPTSNLPNSERSAYVRIYEKEIELFLKPSPLGLCFQVNSDNAALRKWPLSFEKSSPDVPRSFAQYKTGCESSVHFGTEEAKEDAAQKAAAADSFKTSATLRRASDGKNIILDCEINGEPVVSIRFPSVRADAFSALKLEQFGEAGAAPEDDEKFKVNLLSNLGTPNINLTKGSARKYCAYLHDMWKAVYMTPKHKEAFNNNGFDEREIYPRYLTENEISDAFKTMTLDRNAQRDVFRKKYHELALKYHPNKFGGNDEGISKFQEISNANEVLQNYFRLKSSQ